MKPQVPRKISVTAASLLLCLGALNSRAADGTWTNLAGGNYSDPNNWQNGTIADGSGSTAHFDTLNVPSNSTITVNADYAGGDFHPITNGDLYFGDTDTSDGAGNWVLAGDVTLAGSGTNSIIDVNLATGASNNLVSGWATLSIQAGLHGQNTLVKTGPSTLILDASGAKDYSGGTVISNGIVQPTVNNTGLGSGPIIFAGGTLRMSAASVPGSNPSVNGDHTGLPNALVVPDGQTGTIYLNPYMIPGLQGPVSGGGTLNMFVDYVRAQLDDDWSGFSGTLVVASSPRQNSDFRFGQVNPEGFANTTIVFTNDPASPNTTVSMYNAGVAAPTNNFVIGDMSATIPGIVTITSASGGPGTKNTAPMILTVGGLNKDSEFSGNITSSGSGSISIVKVGTGTWILDGPNISYTGMTVVSNGVLQIGNGTSGTPGHSAVITNYATLAFGRSDDVTVTNGITGSGNVEQRGEGTLTIAPAAGANDYTGKTIVKNGSLAVPNESALGTSPASFVADQLTLDGGAFRATTDFSLNDANRGIGLGASGGGLGADAGSTLTVGSKIGGSGDLIITNSGNVNLTGANNYTGRTILAKGTLLLASESPLGTAPGTATADQILFNGGTLRSTATFAIDDANRGVTLGDAGGTISPDTGTTLTISEPVSGSGTLTKAGDGSLVLNGANTFTGKTIISGGSLSLGSSGTLGQAEIAIPSGSTFDISAASSFVLGSGQTISGYGTVSGNLSAAGGTISPGGSVGMLTISGDLTESGGVVNEMEVGSTTNDMILVNGNLNLSGNNTINVTLLGPLPVGTYHLIKYSGSLSGDVSNLQLTGYPVSRVTGSLAIDSANKTVDLVVSGNAGDLVWQGGSDGNTWDLNNTTNWLNGAAADVFLSGDNVTFDATGAANPNVNLTGSLQPGTVTVSGATDYSFTGSGNLTGFANIEKSGTGKLTILTENDNTGPLTISGGTVQVGDGATSGSLGSGDVTDNAALAFDLPDGLTNSSAISGTGTVALQAGSLTLNGDDTYSGGTTVASGTTLQVGAGGNSGAVGTGSVANGGALVFNRSGVLTNAAPITGGGTVDVKGGGTVAFAADSSYTGQTTVSNATLQVGAGGATGNLGATPSAVVNDGATVAFNRSDIVTNSTPVTGTGALRQEGPGKLVLVSSNSYGDTWIDSGAVLQVSDGNSNRFYSVITTNIDTGANTTNYVTNLFGSVTLGTGTINDDGTLVINQAYNSTLSNTVAGAGSLTQIGPGVLTVERAAPNTYSGGTTISNSTVILSTPAGLSGSGLLDAVTAVNQSGLGTGPITFLGNSTLQLQWATRQDPSAAIQPNFANPIVVPDGQTGTIWAPGRYTFGSTVTGDGTLNLGVNYVRGYVTGIFTNFNGHLNIITNAVNTDGTTAFDFRVNAPGGFPKAHLTLSNGVSMYPIAAGPYYIGELTGTPGSQLIGASGSQGVNTTFIVGGLNTDATFDGNLGDNNTIVKDGTGTWTLTGVNGLGGTMVVSNGTLAFGVSPSDGTTVGSLAGATLQPVGPGVIDASGLPTNTLVVGATTAQILSGSGTVKGNVNIAFSGVLSPGFSSNSFGNLTITSNLVVDGATEFYVGHPGVAMNSMVTAPSILIDSNEFNYPTLTVVQAGTNDLVTGDVFKLFSKPISGGYYTVTLPAYNADLTVPYVWTNMLSVDGTIRLLSGGTSSVSLNPTNITFSVSGGQLSLSWPADHTGWRLQVQTNDLSVGISTNWYDVPGSENVTSTNIPIGTTDGSVFYRLVSP